LKKKRKKKEENERKKNRNEYIDISICAFWRYTCASFICPNYMSLISHLNYTSLRARVHTCVRVGEWMDVSIVIKNVGIKRNDVSDTACYCPVPHR